MSEHTPTPPYEEWINDEGLVTGVTSGKVSFDIFDASMWPGGDEEGHKIAGLMTRAVNSHEALVEALEACVENFGPCLTTADAGLPTVIKTIGETADCHTAIRKARAVLKQVRGE